MTRENENLEKEPGENHNPGAPEKKRRTRKIVVAALILMVVLLAGAGGGWYFFLKDKHSVKKPVVPPAVKAMDKPPEVDRAKLFPDQVFLETFQRLELKPSGSIKLITLDIALELLDPGTRQDVEKSQLAIRKVIEAELKKMTWLVLRTPEGKLQLKLELVKKINQKLTRAKIRDLYFINLVMQ